MTHAPDDYALVIGIDHYPEWAGGKKSLHGPVNDAKSFEQWLVKPEGGGLPPENVQVITSRADELGPLQHPIDEAFKKIRRRALGKRKRRFYFYFAGHGFSAATSAARQELCLANWTSEDPGAALQLESYLNASVGCLRFEEGLFFLDCCRVREAAPYGKSSDLECGDPKFDDRHYGVFYATEHYQAGYEPEDEENVRGYFTQALTSILEQGTIEVRDLDRQLSIKVEELAKPHKQIARALLYARRDIFLGPPSHPPGDPRGPGPEPQSEPETTFQLSVRLQTRLQRDVAPGEPLAPMPGGIQLLKGGRLMLQSTGAMDVWVPTGIYTVRVVHGEAVESHDVDLTSDLDLTLSLPRRRSSSPLSSTEDKQEQITDPIVDASRALDGSSTSGVFVAFRNERAPFNGSLIGTIGIPELGLIWPSRSERFSAEPGMYSIVYRRPDGPDETLSVPIATGRDTQIFIVVREGRPLLERASVLMEQAGKGFNPSDALIDAYELALADLVTGGPGPNLKTLHDLLYGKWRNPLFGLVGAHFLLRELLAATQPDLERMQLLDEVIGNLERLLGRTAPDIVALRVARSKITGETTEETQVSSAPLLRASMVELVAGTADLPDLIAPWLDKWALDTSTRSPWAVAKPNPIVRGLEARFVAGKGGTIRVSLGEASDDRLDQIGSIFLPHLPHHVEQDEDGQTILVAAGSEQDYFNLLEQIRPFADVTKEILDAVRAETNRARRLGREISSSAIVKRLLLPHRVVDAAAHLIRMEDKPLSKPDEADGLMIAD